MPYYLAIFLFLIWASPLRAEESIQCAPSHIQSEQALLNIPIDAAALRRFLVWDDAHSEWRDQRSNERPGEQAPIVVLHVWADYCVPCREEFPVLRELAEQLEAQSPGRVQFVYLTETDTAQAMESFLQKYRARMPKGPYYQDTGEVLSASIRRQYGNSLALPYTLVLDEQRVIRYALVGSIGRRRGPLAAAIERIVRLPRRPEPATR